MKRGRKARVSGTSKGGIRLGELAEEEQNSNLGYHSITELPRYSHGCICYKSWLLCEVHSTWKLETKLKIPLRNSDLALNADCEDVKNQSKTDPKRKRCIQLRANDHRFNVVNSCHGLLCLSEPSKNDPVAVSNPVTGEYINLPIPTQNKDKYKPWVDCALGFSPQANQYKVIRTFSQGNHQRFQDSITGEDTFSSREAEIHVLGTSSWRKIGHVPFSSRKLEYPTFLNGALHWVYPPLSDNYIISFDFDNDKFRPIPPPQEVEIKWKWDIILGVLRGCLCMSYFDDGELDVWVMKDYGVQSSWTKKHRLTGRSDDGRWLLGLNEPISVLSNGGVLLFNCRTSSLLFYHPDGTKFNYLKIRGRGEKSKFEAIPYVPSFISLKDVVAREEVEVMNINSRCAGLNLLGECQTLYSQEEDADFDLLRAF